MAQETNVADRRAIVCFVEDRPNLVQQALALRRSLLHSGSADTDLVVFGPPDVVAGFPDDVVSIAQSPIADDPAWRGYRFANSIACLNGAGAERLDEYSHLLRTDVDTFVTPAWTRFYPSRFTVGHGRYANDDDVRGRLRAIAAEFGLTHVGQTNVGSTWYGPTEVVRRTAAVAEMMTRQILHRCFGSDPGAWPGWWQGVASLYGSEIAVNHCAPDVEQTSLLDADSTSRDSTETIPHIHCWHTDALFSKFAFAAGAYRREDHADLDLDVIAEYCLEMSFRSLEDKALARPPQPRTASRTSMTAPERGNGRAETVVLVPRRDGFPDRDKVWSWCRAWWERELPDLPVFEGHHYGGLFNRSAAVNEAARSAGDWQVAVIIDADIVIDPGRVREAISTALETGSMTIPFDRRHDLSESGSGRVMQGDRGSWVPFIRETYTEMCSSCIAVPRTLWDSVGGFDEGFTGWGWEDNAFAAACATFGGPIVTLPGELWHLFHQPAPEGTAGSPSSLANRTKAERYFAAQGDIGAMAALVAQRSQQREPIGIPRILHRVVPESTSRESEAWWERFGELHPGWQLLTHRDPLEPNAWPETSGAWDRCTSGAQLAGLVRLEALWRWGGIYVDSDVEPYRSFEPLRTLRAFAAWEDEHVVPDAVIGAVAGHPAIRACLDLALARLDAGTWESGAGVTTAILPGRSDVLLLPPGSFYPYHYREKHRRGEDHRAAQPWAFAAHHWAGSWLPASR